MKRIIQITFFTLTVITLITLTGTIVIKNNVNKVGDINVNIFRNSEDGFINKNIILEKINNLQKDNISQNVSPKDSLDAHDSLKIIDVRTSDIEKSLNTIPYIDEVDCYLTVKGNILVNIKEKEALLRIYNQGMDGFYIDWNGNIFPLCDNYAPRVLIANGYISHELPAIKGNINDSLFKNSNISEIFQLTQLINQFELLRIQINQIYVNSKGEYDLIPELGDHVVKFGTLAEASTKLENLEAYYRKYLKTNDWDKYKTINLTYKDQIVCTKK